MKIGVKCLLNRNNFFRFLQMSFCPLFSIFSELMSTLTLLTISLGIILLMANFFLFASFVACAKISPPPSIVLNFHLLPQS